MTQKAQTPVDPITVEVVRNYMQSTASQMRNMLIRASFNPVIYEMVDFSLGLFNRKGELIAEGPGIPLFMGTLSYTINHVMAYVGEENVVDGDVLLCTYPYWIGSHAQDAAIIRPIYSNGELFGFAAAKVHWMDIGGKDIYGIDTTDIWQEGLQLFAVKIHKAGKLDNEIVEIIRANTRLPDSVVGDMSAQIAACSLGAKKVIELLSKYGADVVNQAVERILDHGEAITRKAISEMPDGEWSAEGAMDNNGIEDKAIRLKVKVRIQGDEIIVDTTGSAPQQIGPVNCPLIGTISLIRLVVKMLTTPLYNANEGCFRALKVIAPEGSILNPKAPAPVFLYGWSATPAASLIFEALSEAVPKRTVARSGGDIGGVLFSGYDPEDGSYYAGAADECVGQGATYDEDGENALIMFSLGESRNVPAEIIEERHPILVEKYELRQNSGGAGQFRGGLGVERWWKSLADMKFITVIEQTGYPAKGLFGGKSAMANQLVFSPGTPHENRKGKNANYLFAKGERLELAMGGGGGWGNPLERDPSAVLRDVIGEYISLSSARDQYGVVIRKSDDTYALDEAGTRELRKSLSY